MHNKLPNYENIVLALRGNFYIFYNESFWKRITVLEDPNRFEGNKCRWL